MTAEDTGRRPGTGALDATMAGIARSGTFNLAGSAVSAMCQLLVVLIATRLYDATHAGALFAATAVFVIVVALAQLGADEALVRFVASARATGAGDDARRLLAIGLVPILGTSVLAGGLLLVLARPVAGLFGADQQSLVTQMLQVLAVAVPFAAAHETMLAATRGFGRIRPTVVVERVVRAVLQALAVLAVGLAGLGPEALAPAWAGPYLIATALSALALRRTAAASPLVAARAGPRSTTLARAFWTFCAARAVARVCQVALHRLDVILVAALVGTAEAAVYTAATRFIVLGQLVNLAISQVIQPQLAGLLARAQRAAAQAVVRRATTWLVALTWPGYLSLIVLATWLLPVFGAGYASAAGTVAVLAVAMMIATAIGPLDVVLLMEGRSGLSLANTATALVLDVVGCLLLVPPFGILGAATAWAVAVLVRNLLSVLQTRRILQISAGSRELAQVAGMCIACFGLLPLPLVLLGVPVVGVVLATAAGLLGYLAAMWRQRASTGLDSFAGLLKRPVVHPAGATTP